MHYNEQTIEQQLIDTIDLLNFTLSVSFIDKWSQKYGVRILRLFQIRILKSLESRKPLKVKALYKFLVADSGFNPELVINLLNDIDYEIYSPIINGDIESLQQDTQQ